MKRILHLSLLLIVPFLLHADHGRDRLNGKWLSPYFDKEIKLRVKRHEIKVKGLNHRGWTTFVPVRRNLFEDCEGNTVKINNIHDLVYRSSCGERITFVKKGHLHHNHTCSAGCSIDNDYFLYDDGYNDSYDDYYGEYSGYDDYYGSADNSNEYRYNRRDRRNRNRRLSSTRNRIDGRYFVRELDEYVILENTRNGLKAKKRNGDWVTYSQNRNRKNEYIDDRGNKYLIRRDGSITWSNRDRSKFMNLERRKR